jgi:hypothetical protein
MMGFSLLYFLFLLYSVNSFVMISHDADRWVRTQRGFLMAAGDDCLEQVRQAIAEAGFTSAWDESVAILSDAAKLELGEAQECLAKAWNWKSWALCTSSFARKYIQPVEPSSAAVADSLEWLQTGPLGLDSNFLQSAILDCPEAYLCSPEKNYVEALKVAPEKFKDPSSFKALLLEDPSVLQCTYNCVDDGCNSECGNCWVSFQLKAKITSS